MEATTLEPLLSMDETAALLGISRSTVYRLIGTGQLRPIRIGAGSHKDRRLFDPKDIRELIETHKAPRLDNRRTERAA